MRRSIRFVLAVLIAGAAGGIGGHDCWATVPDPDCWDTPFGSWQCTGNFGSCVGLEEGDTCEPLVVPDTGSVGTQPPVYQCRRICPPTGGAVLSSNCACTRVNGQQFPALGGFAPWVLISAVLAGGIGSIWIRSRRSASA